MAEVINTDFKAKSRGMWWYAKLAIWFILGAFLFGLSGGLFAALVAYYVMRSGDKDDPMPKYQKNVLIGLIILTFLITVGLLLITFFCMEEVVYHMLFST